MLLELKLCIIFRREGEPELGQCGIGDSEIEITFQLEGLDPPIAQHRHSQLLFDRHVDTAISSIAKSYSPFLLDLVQHIR